MDEDRDRRIRERAYELWQDSGSPEGRHLDHWAAAQGEIDADTVAAGRPARKKTTAAGKSTDARKTAGAGKTGARPAARKSPMADPGSPGGTAGTGGTGRDQDQ